MKNFIFILIILSTLKGYSMSWDLTHKMTNNNSYTYSESNDDFAFELNYQPDLSLYLWTKESKKIDLQLVLQQQNSLVYADEKKGKIELALYRSLVRYSDINYEYRVGLQQLNFGQALILRPLQWFDNIDPRKENSESDGVYALLAKRYFLNNSNVWGWIILDDEELSDDYSIKNFGKQLEYGGRWQYPIKGSETAISIHHKRLDNSVYSNETKLGFDVRKEMVLGFWAETSLSLYHGNHKSDYASLLTAGADYTISLGNGIYLLTENLFMSDIKDNGYLPGKAKSTAFQLRYPISLFDSVQSLVAYDWSSEKYDIFLSYIRSYDHLTCYLNLYQNGQDDSKAIELVLETKF